MTGVNSTPIHSPQLQNGPGVAPTNTALNPALVASAATADDCWDAFSDAVDDALTAATELKGDAEELIIARNTHEQGTLTQELGTITEEQGEIKENANIQVEGELKSERAANAATLQVGMNSHDSASKVFIVDVDNSGQFRLKSAASMAEPDLTKAHADAKSAFRHDNILGLSSQFCAVHGFIDGQKISFVDESGKKHELTVHILDHSETKQLSNIVNVCLAQIAENTRDNAELSKEDNKPKINGKVHLAANHNITWIRNGRRDKDHRHDDKNVKPETSTQVSRDIARVENSTTEGVRNRLHDAHELSELIAKLTSILAADFRKFDSQNQSLMLDNLKSEHSFVEVPRTVLVAAKS